MNYKESFAAGRERFLTEWKEFLKIASVSTDPDRKQDCIKAAQWLVAKFTKLGLKAELIETGIGHPLVYAETAKRPGKTLLVYGHYDVQPCDPLDQWKSPPFEPQERDGRLYARGAQDNKGQLMYVIEALETVLKNKEQFGQIKLCIEGEEECGSEGLTKLLPTLAGKLSADALLVCDTGTLHPAKGTITMGLRGILHLTVTLTGPNKDLHSGVHGGVVRNPATEMAHLLASLHNADGSIAVSGFLDGLTEPDPADVNLANGGAPTPEQYIAMVGAPALGGEQRFSMAVRGGFRPTIEINGIRSGYDGPGSKTIIPAMARAKISVRLVGGQEPARALAQIEKHLEKHTPNGVKLEISEATVGGPAITLSSRSPAIGKVAQILERVMGSAPLYRWEGASIPIVAQLAMITKGEAVLVGFGLEEDNIHAPNESFALTQFERGYLFACEALSELTR